LRESIGIDIGIGVDNGIEVARIVGVVDDYGGRVLRFQVLRLVNANALFGA
jgi:hypothetical protein